jgi:Ca2+ transporting ATPase
MLSVRFYTCAGMKLTPSQEKSIYTNVGEPTEAALKVLAEKIGCPSKELANALPSMDHVARASAVCDYYEREIPRLLTFEFSRDRKMMSVLVRFNGTGALFAKGAPESVLDRCTTALLPGGAHAPLTPALRASILAQTASYGAEGLRTLALAFVDVADINAAHYKSSSTADYSRFERDLTFVGLVGMLDPPRPEARGAVANCRAAGIRVICITGDNKGTAETICRRIGIFTDTEDLEGKSYTGREFEALSHEEKLAAVQRASLFSRTEPGHKSQLVDLLQSLGLVVAMARSFSRFFCSGFDGSTDGRWR